MKKIPDYSTKNEDKQTAESLVSLIYYFAKDWMRPSPKHHVVLQVFIFILKLPVLILLLALSPVIFIFLFITLVVGL
jgi:hypothetical protein